MQNLGGKVMLLTTGGALAVKSTPGIPLRLLPSLLQLFVCLLRLIGESHGKNGKLISTPLEKMGRLDEDVEMSARAVPPS
ncbi:hypothetical protein Q1695_013568 [Nippostrongylus brasiliensis]|nr:hypothetical protein Q1695_013568 [Nippostrongylus brasiliensis]